MLTYDANQVVALRLHWALKSPGITFITSFRNSDPESLMLELGICFLSFFFLKLKGFPCGSDGKESTCNMGDLGSIPGLERFPGGGHGNPLYYSCLENPHGQRSLVGYSPRGHKELETTE